MRLFLEKGFDATTIEEIAEAVEISPSTFFNYFPSKEEVVFQDDLDPLILAAFDALPADMNPIARLRAAMQSVFGRLQPEQEKLIHERVQLLASTPELRAAMLGQFAVLADQIADLLASRVAKRRDDFALHNIAGALLGVLMGAMITISENPKADMLQVMDDALAHLQAGLPLDWKPERRR